MTREQILELVRPYGVEECLNYYQVYGLRDLTNKQLQKWIKQNTKKSLKGETNEYKRNID